MADSVIKQDLFTISKIAIVLIFTAILTTSLAQADDLTTFEGYAAMTSDQQRAVRQRAAGVIFKAAIDQGETQQVECIEQTYLKGPKFNVKMAHANLREVLESFIEFHYDDSRVEYVMENHLMEVCPSTVRLVRNDDLTTFQEYANMTIRQRSAIRSKAGMVIFKKALINNDEKQKECMRKSFLLKYGDREKVEIAHARLLGRIEAALENPNPDGRVEYLVSYHFMETCPSSEKIAER